jgi:cyclin-dependent kinase-like
MFALGCIIGELVDGQPMFPGEDEIDQLHLLRKAIGELTEQQENYMKENPKFTNVHL